MKKSDGSKKSYFSYSNVESPQKLLFERLANKWYLVIICDLDSESGRFNQLLKRNKGISQKMLSRTLRNFEEDGMLERTVNGKKMPVEVVYRITDFGAELINLLAPLTAWAEDNYDKVMKYRNNFSKKYGGSN